MSFGSDLQGWQSHEALLRMQDYEINMLEGMRKCISHHSKSDREYAASLSSIISVVTQRQNNHAYQDQTPLGETWSAMMTDTSSILKLVSQYADQLGTKVLESITQLVAEKKLLRKTYAEKRNSMEMELDRLLEEVSKSKELYERRLAKLVQSRIKYENMWKKGRSSSKLEDVKAYYTKQESKVRNSHNSYLMALCEANLYQQQYSCRMLPSLLDLQQRLQENLVKICKQVLQQYASFTDWSKKCFQEIHESIQAAASSIDHAAEYCAFVSKQRTEPVELKKHEFDKSVVLNYLPNSVLTLGKIVIDESTIDAIRQSKTTYAEELARCRQRMHCKQQELNEVERSLNTDVYSLSGHVSTRSIGMLRRDLVELQCVEEKLLALLKLIEEPLERLGTGQLSTSISDASDFGSQLNLDSAQQSTPGPQNNLPQNPNIIFSNLRSTITKRIQFRRVRNGGGPPNVVATPSPNAVGEAVAQTPTVVVDETRNAPSAQVADEGIRQAAAAILEGCNVARYTEKDFGSAPDSRSLEVDPDQSSARKRQGRRARTNKKSRSVSVADVSSHDETNHTSSADVDNDYDFLSPGSSPGSEQRPIDTEVWFHGMLPRDEVPSLLVNDGDFLIRVSSSKRTGSPQYVLSVQWGTPRHFIIQETPEGFYRLEYETYATVQQLVKHLLVDGNHVTRKSGVTLRTAVPRREWELLNDDLDLQIKVGSGQFGEVFRGVYKPNGTTVAVKTCRVTLDEDMKSKFLQEARILKQYDHPNIVKFIGIASQRQPVMIVMEFVPGGSLLSFLRKYGAQQTVKTLLRMCSDAAAGMLYLSNRNCIHRDLAARNCLVGENCVVKISDFGMSRQEHEYVITTGKRQIPIKWTAPEALNFGTYTTACDVWSFGILMWEVFSFGSMPYSGLTNSQAADKINEGYRMPPPSDAPDAAYELMLRCWEQEPENRLSFEQTHSELLVLIAQTH